MSDEKIKILEMIQEGKLTAAEGLELLNALGDLKDQWVENSTSTNRFLRIRVTNGHHNKVNVNVPLKLLKIATKFAGVGMKFIPEEAHQEMKKKGIDLSDFDFDELLHLIDQGLVDGKLVDVDADDPKEGPTKVEIYVD